MSRPVGKDTEVVRGVKKSASLMVDFLYTARTTLDFVADANLPPVVMRDKVYRNGLIDARERGVKIRIVTEVTRDDIALIIRNARRLERLTSDILEITKIESGAVKLYRETLDPNVKVQNIAKDAKTI
jgi:signal transduction histidine kinase